MSEMQNWPGPSLPPLPRRSPSPTGEVGPADVPKWSDNQVNEAVESLKNVFKRTIGLEAKRMKASIDKEHTKLRKAGLLPCAALDQPIARFNAKTVCYVIEKFQEIKNLFSKKNCVASIARSWSKTAELRTVSLLGMFVAKESAEHSPGQLTSWPGATAQSKPISGAATALMSAVRRATAIHVSYL